MNFYEDSRLKEIYEQGLTEEEMDLYRTQAIRRTETHFEKDRIQVLRESYMDILQEVHRERIGAS